MNLRSLEVIDFSVHNKPIHLVGMGATGSWLYQQLMLMGCTNLHCWDGDKVEVHNVHNQLYDLQDVGLPKTEGAERWAHNNIPSGELEDGIKYNHAFVGRETAETLNGIVFILTDSFESRREIMEGIVAGQSTMVVFESRVSPYGHEIRAVNPFNQDEVKRFYDSLGDDNDEDAYVTACGTSIQCVTSMQHCACTLASLLYNFLNAGKVDQAKLNTNLKHRIIVGG